MTLPTLLHCQFWAMPQSLEVCICEGYIYCKLPLTSVSGSILAIYTSLLMKYNYNPYAVRFPLDKCFADAFLEKGMKKIAESRSWPLSTVYE